MPGDRPGSFLGLEDQQQFEFRRATLLGVIQRVAREGQRGIDVERQLHHPHLGYIRLLGKASGEAVDGDDGAAVIAAEGPDLAIDERAWNAQLGSYVVAFDGDDVDASLLLLEQLGFVAADDHRFAGTVAAIERQLKHGELIYRYTAPDDFGTPQTAFTICTFWYIDALAALGRKDEARMLFERMLSHRNHVGLLSEDIDVRTGELWGNFPQTYSMVGLINSALRLSKSWEEGL